MSTPTALLAASELDEVFARSHRETVVVVKHSVTCGISQAAWSEVLAAAAARPNLAWYVVRIQDARTVSNALATRTGIRHESPQVLILRDGRTTWHASHWDITAATVVAAIDELV